MEVTFTRNQFNLFSRLLTAPNTFHDPDSVEKFNECEELAADGKPKRKIKTFARFKDGQPSDFMNLSKLRNLIDEKRKTFQDSTEIKEQLEELISDFDLQEEQAEKVLAAYEELEKAVGEKILPEEIKMTFSEKLVATIQKYLKHFEPLQAWPELEYWSVRMLFEDENSDMKKLWNDE